MAKRLTQQEVECKLKLVNITLIDRYINSKTKHRMLCHCGKEFYSNIGSVFRGGTKSCGCAFNMINSIDITNQKYGRLLAIERTTERRCKSLVWKFLCDCGKYAYIDVGKVRSGNTKSCGCLQKEKARKTLLSIHPFQKGTNHPSYKGELIDRTKRELLGSRNWKISVYTRDDYTCRKCKKRGGRIHAHHLNSWNKFPEQRYNIQNAVTLCVKCHYTFHKNYGFGDNTVYQFIDYVGKE